MGQRSTVRPLAPAARTSPLYILFVADSSEDEQRWDRLGNNPGGLVKEGLLCVLAWLPSALALAKGPCSKAGPKPLGDGASQ